MSASPDKTNKLKWVAQYLERLVRRDFYGSINLKFKQGRVYLLDVQETVRVPEDGAEDLE